MTTPYTTGTISLTNGSSAVIGNGTAWETALIVGGVIYVEAEGNPLPILSVDADDEITAAVKWTGATGEYNYALVRDTAYASQQVANANALAQLIAELQAGSLFKYDVARALSELALYDERPEGFAFLAVDQNPAQLFIKLSSASGDWSDPKRYAQGEQGPAPTIHLNPVVTGAPGTQASANIDGDGSIDDPYVITFTIPAGIRGINWRGPYSNVTTYAAYDGVRDNGSVWIAKRTTTGNIPPVLPSTSNDDWELFAPKGQDGTGIGDVVGPSGGVTADTLVAFDGTSGKQIKSLTPAQARGVIQADIIGALRNRIINGDGSVNQRAATTATDDAYAHDRHYALTQTAAIGISTVANPATGIRSMMRLTQTQAAAQRMGYAQIIESSDTYPLRGQLVTLGGKLRYSNAAAIRYAVLEWTGTADSVTSDVVLSWTSTSYAAGGFFLASNLIVNQIGTITPTANTITDWNITATIGATANNVIVIFWTEGTAAQNSTLDMRWYLIEGDTRNEADPFLELSLAVTTMLCQRFYFTSLYDGSGYQASGAVMSLGVRWPVRMRSTPTVTQTGGSGVNAVASSVDLISADSCRWLLTAGGATGYVGFASRIFTADAEL